MRIILIKDQELVAHTVTLVMVVEQISSGTSPKTEQSWKAAKTIEEARAHGRTADYCQGDNSDNKYRAQMNQNRKGYMSEPLVPQGQCHENHATLK